ncbi:MAG: FAD:protein FMN transferase [Thiotrichales bacterium]
MHLLDPSPRLCVLVGLLGLALLLAGCGKPTLQQLGGSAQGTTYHVRWWSAPRVTARTLHAAVEAELARIDQALSNYRADSAIEVFNANPAITPQAVPAELVELLRTANAVRVAGAGCYDLTIKPLTKLWGFRDEVLTIPPPESLASVLESVGQDLVEIVDGTRLRKTTPTVTLDVSSIAQGHSVARLAQVLEATGIHNYLIEIGGELQTRGQKPDGSRWRVAVERPLPGARRVHKIIELPATEPVAVMTSGTYRHYFDADGRRYSHILDAHTGAPVTHDLVSVTVLHPDATLADAWSTALLCLGAEDALALAEREGLAAMLIELKDGALVEHMSAALTGGPWTLH